MLRPIRRTRRDFRWNTPCILMVFHLERAMNHRTLDPDDLPDVDVELKGHDVASLGPGDSSDTGADMMGLGRDNDNSDRQGTGERMSVDDDELRSNADIDFDRIVDSREAGLGGGLDQAEEAQLEITDEEMEELFRRRPR